MDQKEILRIKLENICEILKELGVYLYWKIDNQMQKVSVGDVLLTETTTEGKAQLIDTAIDIWKSESILKFAKNADVKVMATAAPEKIDKFFLYLKGQLKAFLTDSKDVARYLLSDYRKLLSFGKRQLGRRHDPNDDGDGRFP